MNRYQLPCPSCGEINLVTVTQAGQYIDCFHCDQEISIPRMGAIRQLKPEFEESEHAQQGRTRAKSSEWSPTKGLVFAIGLFLLVFGGTLAYRSSTDYFAAAAESEDAGKFLVLIDLDERIEKLKSASIAEVNSSWGPFMKTGFSPWHGSRYFESCKKRDLAQSWLIATGSIALVGSVLSVGAFLIPSGKKS